MKPHEAKLRKHRRFCDEEVPYACCVRLHTKAKVRKPKGGTTKDWFSIYPIELGFGYVPSAWEGLNEVSMFITIIDRHVTKIARAHQILGYIPTAIVLIKAMYEQRLRTLYGNILAVIQQEERRINSFWTTKDQKETAEYLVACWSLYRNKLEHVAWLLGFTFCSRQ